MKHYVVVLDWAENDAEDINIIGVAHSLDEAKEMFNARLVEERAFAEEHGYEIYEDVETLFDAGENGYYAASHTRLYIQEVG